MYSALNDFIQYFQLYIPDILKTLFNMLNLDVCIVIMTFKWINKQPRIQQTFKKIKSFMTEYHH